MSLATATRECARDSDDTKTMLLLVRRRARLAPSFVDKRRLVFLGDRDSMTDAGAAKARIPKLSELVRMAEVRHHERTRGRTRLVITAVIFFAAGVCAAAVPRDHARAHATHVGTRIAAWFSR